MKLLFMTTVAAVVLSTSVFAVDRRPPAKAYAAKARVPTIQSVFSNRRSDCVYSSRTGRELGCDPDPFVRSSIANDPSNSGD